MSLVIDTPDSAPDKLKPFIPMGAKWYALAEIDMGTYAVFRGLVNRLNPQRTDEIEGTRVGLPGKSYLFSFGMN